MSTPLQGQGAHPTSSHLLPVTPLGKLGMVPAAEILQNPHFNFRPPPRFPARCDTSVHSPSPTMSPSPFPRLRKSPEASNPLGKSQEGTQRLLPPLQPGVTLKPFTSSGLETSSVKMC